ncbi:MAG TPA: hypothetical protein VF939_21675 [Puia sp.]
MKRVLQVIPILILGHFTFGQTRKLDLPINPSTGLICILDSVKVGANYPVSGAKELISKWGDYTAYNNPTQKLFGYIQREKEVTLGFLSIYEYETQRGKFYKSGQLQYLAKKNGKIDSSDKTNGDVSFRINFEIKGEYILFELTDFSYAGLKNELGKFEDPLVLGPDGVHFLSEKQKPWNRVKKEYYVRFQVICGNLKEFINMHYQSPGKPILLTDYNRNDHS